MVLRERKIDTEEEKVKVRENDRYGGEKKRHRMRQKIILDRYIDILREAVRKMEKGERKNERESS